MKLLLSCITLCAVFPLTATAYIIPTRTILEKVSDNAGKGIFAIEQEVTFQHADTPFTVKETWIIESDRSMRLTVSASTDDGKKFTLQNVYVNNEKSFLVDKSKKSEHISPEFIERYFNSRNPDALANLLIHQKIIPTGAMQRKSLPRNSADIKHTPESWVRFGRSQGVVTYAFGAPTPADKDELYPGLWIEQDQFLIRKLRFPSQAEVTANDYSSFSKNLFYPKTRVVRWDNNSVEIKLLSATPRPQTAAAQIAPSKIEISTNFDSLSNLPSKEMVMEFYKRFR